MRGATRVFESLVAFLTEKNYNEEVRGYSEAGPTPVIRFFCAHRRTPERS